MSTEVIMQRLLSNLREMDSRIAAFDDLIKLRNFVVLLEAASTDDRALIVMNMVQYGTATWISPTSLGASGTPVSDRHYIIINEIEATGSDGAEALANWIVAARLHFEVHYGRSMTTIRRSSTKSRGAIKSRGVAA